MVRMSKDKRLETGKLFYDFAKLTFAAMVVGAGSAMVSEEARTLAAVLIILVGALVTFMFAYVGYRILSNIK